MNSAYDPLEAYIYSQPTLKPSFAKPINRFFDEDSGMHAHTPTAYLGYVEELCQRYCNDISTQTVVTKLRYYKLRRTHILEVYASYRDGGRVFPGHTITLKAFEESEKLVPSIRLVDSYSTESLVNIEYSLSPLQAS